MNRRTNPRDSRAIAQLTDTKHRWLWLREHEGRQYFVLSNYEPTRENGLVGQHRKLVKLPFPLDDTRASKTLGVKPKNKPKPKNSPTEDFWATVDTVKPSNNGHKGHKRVDVSALFVDIDSLFETDDNINALFD